jgi:hypothetical protein
VRQANEVWISLSLLGDMVAKGHRIEAEVIEGVDTDAKLLGAQVAWPYATADADGGVLILKYDRPVPQVMLRDLRAPDQRMADAAAAGDPK